MGTWTVVDQPEVGWRSPTSDDPQVLQVAMHTGPLTIALDPAGARALAQQLLQMASHVELAREFYYADRSAEPVFEPVSGPPGRAVERIANQQGVELVFWPVGEPLPRVLRMSDDDFRANWRPEGDGERPSA